VGWVCRVVLLSVMSATAAQTASAQSITVAAAADLNYALTDLASQFERNTRNKVVLTIGASGILYSQITNGAPFDLFFSADEEYPKRLVGSGIADVASLRVYAIGHLVLWVPNSSSLDPSKLQMGVLTESAVKRIAIANPQHAPYGRAAMAALEHYGLKAEVADKLVLGESVSQAAQFVQSGNAQAGLIAMSLAKSPAMANGKYWELPQDSYPELRQAVVIVSASKQKQTAQAFLDFVLSPKGQAVFSKYGLSPLTHP
jgi:molybdate transport system substrate-binding protein